nr:stress response protein nst1-like [Danaus plexippus plexippus]
MPHEMRHEVKEAKRTRPHVRKQLFLTPVNKFTVKPAAPSVHFDRIKSCLEEYTAPRHKIKTKAASMEDLTPTKRIKREKTVQDITGRPAARVAVSGSVEQRAGARVARFMLLAAWRRRRHEIRFMRKTLEFQVSCSERLRLQVSALKSLLESDTAKVRLAMRELDRLKKMLRDKEEEKALLEKEKVALEKDVSAAEDRASEMSIGWRNSRNELENTRAAAHRLEQQLKKEQDKVDKLEGELSQHKVIVRSCQAQAAALRRRLDERGELLQQTEQRLAEETEAREQCLSECSSLRELVSRRSAEARARAEQAAALQADLQHVRDQLEAWPASLTRLLCAARSWIRRPMSVSQTVLWSLTPARHGC